MVLKECYLAQTILCGILFDDIEMLEKMELSQNEYEMIFRKNALKVLNIEEESK